MRSFLILLLAFPLQPFSLSYPSLVDQFYRERHQNLFWLLPGEEATAFRNQLLSAIDSAAWHGLDSNRYHPKELRELNQELQAGSGSSYKIKDSLSRTRWDRAYTDAAITFCKELYQGAGIYSMFSYDGVSPRYEMTDNKFLLDKLIRMKTAPDLSNLIDNLEPETAGFRLLRDSLSTSLQHEIPFKATQLATAMNEYRWIHHLKLERYIVVNIAAATLHYYKEDSIQLAMKVVVGKASKRTPRFAAYCDKIILYPYWNVPRKIAVNEFLPVFKKSSSMVDAMNMQIIDTRGKVLDPSLIQWSLYNKDNFPYSMRQSTGCDNALGVIKFDINSPYDVYMHDTNFKIAFLSGHRYYSHGCIRLEKPMELGNELLPGKLDSSFLRSCLKDQQPVTLSLDKPVPVFVVYLTAEADDNNKVNYHKDVYHLLK